VTALAVVGYLDVLKHSFTGLFPGPESSRVDHLVFDGTEKGFGTGIVVAVALSAHTAKHAVLGK